MKAIASAAAERIGEVKCYEVTNESLTEITPVCAETLLGTASLIAAWKSTSDSDRDHMFVSLVKAGHSVELVARLMRDLGHNSTILLTA